MKTPLIRFAILTVVCCAGVAPAAEKTQIRYESTAQTGMDVYKSERSRAGGYPETKHQKEVLKSGNQ